MSLTSHHKKGKHHDRCVSQVKECWCQSFDFQFSDEVMNTIHCKIKCCESRCQKRPPPPIIVLKSRIYILYPVPSYRVCNLKLLDKFCSLPLHKDGSNTRELLSLSRWWLRLWTQGKEIHTCSKHEMTRLNWGRKIIEWRCIRMVKLHPWWRQESAINKRPHDLIS